MTKTTWFEVDSPAGRWVGVVGPRGLVSLDLASARGAPQDAVRDDRHPAARALRAWFDGKRRDLDLDVDLSGRTEFTRRVLDELRRIPWGTTATYGEIARRVGRPNAARAVGQAVGSNPVPVVVPCHRVLAANRRLGGFSAGLDVKRALLRIEGVTWDE